MNMTPSTSPIEQLLQPFDGAVPGVSALLLDDGNAIFARALGMADIEQGAPVTIATNFRLASVTKQITAAAILRLVAQGALALDTPLARFFAPAPAFWNDITLHHLLTHTSGLLDYEELIPPDTIVPLRDRDVLELVRPHNRGYTPPGAAYRYSNTAYCLLALIIERVAARPFATFLREQIFAPLGMNATIAYEASSNDVARRAYGYSRQGATFARTDQSLTSSTLGDGGVYSSTIDLERWDAALNDDSLLPPELRAALFAPHATTPDGEAYGYGWFLTSIAGERAAYHTGETIGFRTAIMRLLDRRRSAIVLTNRGDAEPIAIAHALIQYQRNAI